MSGFPVDGSNYTVNSSFNMSRTANIKGLTCSSNCTILTNGYFLSVSDISVNSGNTLILDNSGGGGVASSFNLNSGILQLNLANDLPCNITNNGNLIFNLPYKDCIYYGSLGGSGTFKKTGAYNLTMTNNNTISGAVEVDSGTMTVNGTLLNSTITVDSSANLSGFGSVGNVIISPNATISSSKINNGLTVGSVSNNLVAGSGITVNNNIVSLTSAINIYSANLSNPVQLSYAPFAANFHYLLYFNYPTITNNIITVDQSGGFIIQRTGTYNITFNCVGIYLLSAVDSTVFLVKNNTKDSSSYIFPNFTNFGAYGSCSWQRNFNVNDRIQIVMFNSSGFALNVAYLNFVPGAVATSYGGTVYGTFLNPYGWNLSNISIRYIGS